MSETIFGQAFGMEPGEGGVEEDGTETVTETQAEERSGEGAEEVSEEQVEQKADDPASAPVDHQALEAKDKRGPHERDGRVDEAQNGAGEAFARGNRDGGDKEVEQGKLSSPTAGVPSDGPDPPLRIVVRCLSHKIPGPRANRTATMANIICQHYFQRDTDPHKDQIKSLGLQDIDGKKVRFLLESGTLAAGATLDDMAILAFKWTGEKL